MGRIESCASSAARVSAHERERILSDSGVLRRNWGTKLASISMEFKVKLEFFVFV